MPTEMRGNPARRDTSIEAYRVFLMLLICLLHSISMGIAPNQHLLGGVLWAVCGFIFISGWFGIRFSAFKLLRLFMTGVFCGGLAAAIGYFAGISISCEKIVQWTVRRWFLCAYMVLMLLSPFLNVALENPRRVRNGILAVFVLLMWNWLSSSRLGLRFGPSAAGLGDYTFTMMIIVYIAARLIRKSYDNGVFLQTSIFAKKILVPATLILLLLLICLPCHFSIYSSPVALCMAVAVFCLFRQLKTGRMLGNVVLFIAPSMFSIYLLHSNEVGFAAIKHIQRFLSGNGVPQFVFIPLTAMTVFVACLALDMLRRGLCRLCHGWIGRVETSFDELCSRADAKICSLLKLTL